MRTLRFSLEPESMKGMKMRLDVDSIVSDEEDAEEEGKRVAIIAIQFLRGFSSVSHGATDE